MTERDEVGAGVAPGVDERDGLVLGRGVPGWVLRAVLGVLGVGIVAVPLSGGNTFGTLVVLVPAVVAAVYAPASPAPAAVIAVVALLVTLADGDPLRVQVLVLIPLVHLFHVACALAGVLPHDGRLHLSALRPAAVRFACVQVAVFALAAVSALLPRGPVPAVVEAVALLGLAVVAVLVVRLARPR